jgi:pantetheine-phosphate adenylyltransferase
VRTALFPGSFDPVHLGHVEIVEQAAKLFDRVVVAAMRNPQKGEPLFDLEERKAMLRESFAGLDNVEVTSFSSLVVDLALELGVDVIVKGLRVASDFEYELQMAQMNRAISGVETVFLPCASRRSFIASSLVRDIARYGGAERLGEMVPTSVAVRLKEKFGESAK